MLKNLRSDVFLIVLASISWVLLTTYTFQLTAPGWDVYLEKFFHGDKIFVKNVFLTCFFLFLFLFFKDLYNREIEEKMSRVEWRVFAINIVCLFLHSIILVLEHYATAPFELVLWLNVLNNFNILIGTLFCANCFFFFKKLILFQKSNQINFIWKVFEYMIFATVLLTVFNVDVTEVLTFVGLLIYAVLALYLSMQMRWVAFLSKSKKIKTIIRFVILFVICCLILQNFFFESFAFGEGANNHLLVIDCASKFFLISTFTFVSFYSIASILILFFNLPTSSAFEQKVIDSNNYKKLSQTLHADRNEFGIYNILLETSVSTSNAVFGFIVSYGPNSLQVISHTLGSSKEESLEVQQVVSNALMNKLDTRQVLRNLNKIKLDHPVFLEKSLRSALINPIYVKDELAGGMMLFKDLEDGFENEAIEIIDSYVLQTSISVENRELLKVAIENERYREELKIAQSVKGKLLAKSLDFGTDIDIAVLSKSSDQVGGDFYDYYNYSSTKSIIVLGDVSGHGTSAAFNMAQLKGVFQTSVRNQPNFDQIPKMINESLYHCLEGESFVTMSFFLIDRKEKEMTHYRCGHNPSIFSKNELLTQLKPPGIGLGMINNEKFSSILVKEKLEYRPNNILLCYTDGFVEAKNDQNQYFGIEGMERVLLNSKGENAQSVVDALDSSLLKFMKGRDLIDDYSCLVIKF